MYEAIIFGIGLAAGGICALYGFMAVAPNDDAPD